MKVILRFVDPSGIKEIEISMEGSSSIVEELMEIIRTKLKEYDYEEL